MGRGFEPLGAVDPNVLTSMPAVMLRGPFEEELPVPLAQEAD